nr:MAG TPA_asm: hypothetical protein [Caudoviricetes sp.]
MKKAASNGRRLHLAPYDSGRQSRPRRFHGAGLLCPILGAVSKWKRRLRQTSRGESCHE